jgi:hypothetical protein
MADKPQDTKPFNGTLRITARPEGGFRRCGRLHPPAPVDHPPGTFTEGEVARLMTEPKLVAMEIATPTAAPAAEPKKPAGT